MTILRVKKNKNNPYVILHKSFLEDPKISLKLKGFLAYCLSKPDNWKFHIRQMASILKEGKDAIYAIINEGIEYGYIEREAQIKNGKFQPSNYIIHEIKIKSTVSEFPDPELPDPESQTLLINNRLNNKKEREEAEPPTPTFSFLRVSMSQDKYDKLVFDCGVEKVNEILNRLDEYADINPKRFKQYACHASVIRKWIREDNQKASKKPYNQSSVGQVTQDIALSKIIVFKAKEKGIKDIVIGHDYIEFQRGQQTDVIKFGDKGFKEQCINALRKMNLIFHDL